MVFQGIFWTNLHECDLSGSIIPCCLIRQLSAISHQLSASGVDFAGGASFIGGRESMKRSALLILGMLASMAMAGEHRVDAKGAFERIKALAGEWQGIGDKANEHLSYE